MTAILSILALGLFDRIRGSGWFAYGRDIGLIGMGIVVALLLNATGWTMLYAVSAVAIGGAPGWGNPLGAAYDGRPMGTNYEWWQIGPWRDSTFAALVTRGFMWGVLLWPVSVAACVAFTVAFAAAPYLARWLKLPWAWMEFGRGMLVAILIITMG